MERTLIIYDDLGFMLSNMRGTPEPREPVGVPFLWVEIPEGKRIKTIDGIGVDVSVTPHQVILEDIPPSETQTLRDEVDRLNNDLLAIYEVFLLGGM